jgi:hypothetical protein
MTQKLITLFIVLLAICIARDSLSQSNDIEGVTLKAFGGNIQVPEYMRILVQKLTADSYEIRILKKMDFEGDLESIIIERPPQRYKLNPENLSLVDEYELNGFSVELFKPNSSKWGFKLLSAQVIRCDEIGQIIFKHRPQLDQYLMEASSADCQE